MLPPSPAGLNRPSGECPDGEQAWNAFERSLPDLIVLDLLLPRMDDLELCRRVRARSSDVPLIFLTSEDEEFDQVLGLELEEALRRGSLELDGARHTARWKGRELAWTATEFRILFALAREPGYLKSREQLLREGFPHDQYMSYRTVDTRLPLPLRRSRIKKTIPECLSLASCSEVLRGCGHHERIPE